MLKIAIIQFNPLFGDISANQLTISALLGRASGANLVVLPELASTGYNFHDRKQALSLSEDPSVSSYLKLLTEAAKNNKQYIVSGFSEGAGDGIYNSSVLTGPDGILGIYRKMHLFMLSASLYKNKKCEQTAISNESSPNGRLGNSASRYLPSSFPPSKSSRNFRMARCRCFASVSGSGIIRDHTKNSRFLRVCSRIWCEADAMRPRMS